jgi:hypothetical protein
MFKIIISLLVSITIISVESEIEDFCSGIGQICGGFNGKTCCVGLVCGPIKNLAKDIPGTCKVEKQNIKICSEVGEACGGRLYSKHCCAGLKCGPIKYLARDLPGKCHQEAL